MADRFLSSGDNEKIKLYRRLCSDKKVRRETGLFPLEGARLVSDGAALGADYRYIFATAEALEKYPGCIPADRYGDRLYRISPELAAKISDTGSPQGIFAVCGIPDVHGIFREIRPRGRYIILDGLQDPGNMGTVIRTADALGIDGVAACGCCDIFSPKAVRSAMGALLRVRTMCGGFEETVKLFSEAGIPIFSAVVGEAQDIKECGFSRGGAVIIGNEGSGIPGGHITGLPVTIKMRGNANSLNAAMAAGIIMWELMR